MPKWPKNQPRLHHSNTIIGRAGHQEEDELKDNPRGPLKREGDCYAKIGPAGLNLAEKPAKTGPPRGPCTFATKIGPAGPILAAKNGPLLPESVPHEGPILAKNYLPKLVPPQSGTLIPVRTWLHGCSYYIYSYACMAI